MNARDKMAEILAGDDLYYDTGSHLELSVDDAAAAILAAGYRPPARTITFDECESLPDGSVILTPGQIVFSKYDDWFKPGSAGWMRCEEGYGTLKTSSLDPQMHFPATVLYEPGATP
jgi:hypothetical protein